MTANSLRKSLVVSLAAICGAALAQEQVPESTDPPTQTTEPTQSQVTPAPNGAQATMPIEDQKVEQFADAYVAVQKIQQEAATKLDDATDPAKQQQAQAAVENEMIAAVEKTGLKLEEFNSIVQTMTADANLRARVVAEIRERTGG